jgi:hypothetical protein
VGSGDAFPERWPAAAFWLAANPTGQFELRTNWMARDATDFEYADGDAFSYSVRDSEGNELFGTAGTVRWESYNPTPQCPTRALLCQQAKVQ